tara:strand:- start:10 stop:252 length:243 start_codon:yes stop_codon:yes gene_type:complete
LVLFCLFSGAELFGTESATSLEMRFKAVTNTFHASFKTRSLKTIAELLTSIAALGQAGALGFFDPHWMIGNVHPSQRFDF